MRNQIETSQPDRVTPAAGEAYDEDGELRGAIESDKAWTLSDDRRTVRLHLPPLPVEGMPEPVIVQLAFDADAIDDMLRRLAILRAQMVAPG